jgi:GNAT superfamily N-acetyltransferase
MDEIVIRPARPQDFPELGRIWLRGTIDPVTGAPPAHLTAESLSTRLDTETASGNWRVFAAESGGRLAALLALEPAERGLREIFVEDSLRSRGIGKALLDFTKAELRPDFWLRTHVTNVQAHRFYEREGLTFLRIEPHPQHPEAMFRIYAWRSPIGAPRR